MSYRVEVQDWQHWPRALIVTHKWTVGHNNHSEQRRYVPERTCRPHGEWERLSQQQEYRFLTCDCGEELGKDERDVIFGTRLAKLPNHCPNCGARIIWRKP